MDHLFCLDSGTGELESLVIGNKSMILRGDDAGNLLFRRVREGDNLFFLNGPDDLEVRAMGKVNYVYCSDRLTREESFETIIRNQDKLQLPDDQFYRWAGKRYLLLIGIAETEKICPFRLSEGIFSDTSGWLSVENIGVLSVSKS